jgi:hypothetical protein
MRGWRAPQVVMTCRFIADHRLGVTVHTRVVEDVDIDDSFWEQHD